MQLRLAQYALAVAVKQARDGALRLNSEQYDEILRRQGSSSPSKHDRELLKRRVKHATVWLQICGTFGSGLLCLLPLHSIPESSYTLMTSSDIKAFQSIASAHTVELESRCKIGASVLKMFSIDFEFEFEYDGLSLDNEAFRADIVSYLQPAVYPNKNLYTPSHPWPKPSTWIWHWPQDPTWAPEELCKKCITSDCICFADLPQNRHRILDYSIKGRGVQARGASPGKLAFCKGDYIHEVVGELKPSDFNTDDYMAVDVYRLDIDGLTCRLYCGQKKGNWTRLINHCCEPCAEITVEIRSGRARVMLRALHDIQDGQEITIFYGNSFTTDKPCLCEVCGRGAIS